MKIPRVSRISGAPKTSSTGRTNALRIPRIKEAPINAAVLSYEIPRRFDATITPTVVTSQRKTKCRMADVRRTPARNATVALQNPLAPAGHGVFGLRTFNFKKQCLENQNPQKKVAPAIAPAASPPTGKRAGSNRKKRRALLRPGQKRSPPPRRRNQARKGRHGPLPKL